MDTKLRLSVQSGDWMDILFGGDIGAMEAFRFIRECGFSAIDYNLDTIIPSSAIVKGELNTFFDADIKEILEHYRPVKEAAIANDIFIGQAHGLFPMRFEEREDIADYLIMATEKLLAVCQYLGCPALVVHPVREKDPDLEWERNMTMYRKLIPAGKKYGVKICLENLFATANGVSRIGPCTDPYEACRYIDLLNEEAGEEIFGFCFDVGHANLTRRNMRKDLQILGKRVTALHIHENDASRDLHLIPYTQRSASYKSTTDWEGMILGLRDIGYEGTLNFETFAGILEMPTELIPATLKYIAAIGEYFKKEIEK